jgi:hypothetical protein
VIQKLVKLCTTDLVQLMNEVEGTHPMDLEDKETDIEYLTDDLLEGNYLEPIYAANSRLAYEEWLTQSKQKKISELWYVPQNLRMLVFCRVAV